MRIVHVLSIAMMLTLVACNGNATIQVNHATQVANDFGFLKDMGLNVDSLVPGKSQELTRPQYEKLIKPLGVDYEEDMGTTSIVEVRATDDTHTMIEYRQTNGAEPVLILATYDRQGNKCDALRIEDHQVWPVDPEMLTDNLLREFSREVCFAGDNHFTIKAVLRQGVINEMDNEHWAVRWHQDYDVNADGHFVFKAFEEDSRTGNKLDIDETVLANMMLSGMLVQSQVDGGVMDAWNAYIPDAEKQYGGQIKAVKEGYIRMNLSDLYALNPQRFLRWMAAHRGASNHFLPHFEISDGFIVRADIQAQIDSMPNADDRAWLHAIVDKWPTFE